MRLTADIDWDCTHTTFKNTQRICNKFISLKRRTIDNALLNEMKTKQNEQHQRKHAYIYTQLNGFT